MRKLKTRSIGNIFRALPEILLFSGSLLFCANSHAQGAQAIATSTTVVGGVDYGRLSIQDAVKRLLEVDRDIRIRRIMERKTILDIALGRRDIWLPRVETGLGAVKPLRILFAGADQAPNIFAEERISASFVLDTNAPFKLARDIKNSEVSAAEVQGTATERVRDLIKTYYELETYQNGYAYYSEAEEETKSFLKSVRGKPSYSKLEQIEIINFLKTVDAKKLTLLGKLKHSRRKLKMMLGLDDYEDLNVSVNPLPEDTAEINKMVEEYSLRQKDYSCEILRRKLAKAEASADISKKPLAAFTASPGLSLLQREKTQQFFKKNIINRLDLSFTDFGYSGLSKRADRTQAEIAGMELAKASYELENSDAYRQSTLASLAINIQNYKEYIARTGAVLKLLRERVSLPADYLLRVMERYYEARYFLRDNLAQYIITLSELSADKQPPAGGTPQNAKLTLRDILAFASKSSVTDERIAAKKEELAQTSLQMQQAEIRPSLGCTFLIEYVDVSGASSKNTRTMLALEGLTLSGKREHLLKAAQASYETALWQKKTLENIKYGALLKDYFKMLYYTRALDTVAQMKAIKDAIMGEISKDQDNDAGKLDMDTNLIYLQRMELERLKNDLESFAELSKSNIRKWTHIPPDQPIGVVLPDCLETESCDENLVNAVRDQVLPHYDPQAALKSAKSKLSAALHAEEEPTAFGGLIWQLRGELMGPNYDGWRNINRAGIFSLTMPWGHSDRELKKSITTQKRIRAELGYEDERQGHAQERERIQLEYEAARDTARALKKRYDNIRAQMTLSEQLYGIGTRSHSEIENAKLEVLLARIEYEESFFNYLYALSMRLLVFGSMPDTDAKPAAGKQIVVKSLQNAIDMAVAANRGLKGFHKLVVLERDTLDYYAKFKLSGAATGDIAKLDAEQPKSKQLVKSLTAMSSYELDLVRGRMIDKQRTKIKMAEEDFESAKLGLVADVVAAYTDYFASKTKYDAVRAHYLDEKANLEGMKELYKTGVVSKMDYLKQAEFVETLWSKLFPIIKSRESAKKILAAMITEATEGKPAPQIEIKDSAGEMAFPSDNKAPLPLREPGQAQKALVGRLSDRILLRGRLEAQSARLDADIASTWIKSLGVNAIYAGGTKSETNYELYEKIGIITTLSTLTEFASLSSFNKIYEPTLATVAKIGFLDEEMSGEVTSQKIMNASQKAKQLFEEYAHTTSLYEKLNAGASKIESFALRQMESARAGGKISVIRQTEIKQALLNSRTDRIEAYYRMLAIGKELDQYLKAYTGKSLNSFEGAPNR